MSAISATQGTGTTLRHAALRVLAMLMAACVFALAAAGVAKAEPQVGGIDFQGTGSVLSGNVEVAEVWGYSPDDTLFLRVKQGRKIIADKVPLDLSGNDKAEPYGVVTVDIDGFNETLLKNGGYTIEIEDQRSEGATVSFSGKLYGVYAQIDGKDYLIGTRTLAGGESRTYTPPETIYIDDSGTAYNLQGESDDSEPQGALYYIYKAGSKATDVTATIKYVDYSSGDVIDTTEFTVGKKAVYRTIPGEIVKGGKHYRTICGIADADGDVMFQNPGRTSITVYCIEVQIDEDYVYTATIQMVQKDDKSNIIGSDKVAVRGNYTYTAPSTIYKTETVDGERAMVTYSLAKGQDAVIDLAAQHEAGAKAQTYQVAYNRSVNANEVTVTFNLLDGTQEPSAGRTIDTDKQTVSAKSPTATPPATVTKGGETYTIAGAPADYAYSYEDRTTVAPSVNVYYVPEGYEANDDYTVTVNYVNYANNAVIDSQTFTSSPDDQGPVAIDTPASFRTGNAEYIRLDGQENLSHSYYSRNRTYTVYYRDADDNLAPTSVSQVRVVFDRGTTTTTTTTTGTTATPTAPAANTPVNAQLNGNGTYTTPGGQNANGTLSNNSGVDSTTERINDDTTPLAQYEGEQQQPAEQQGGIDGGIIAGAVAALAVIAGLLVYLLRKRRDDEEAQA